MIFLLACAEPCDAYAEEQFWTDLGSASCDRDTRCGFSSTCAETASYLAYEREELEECGAAFDPCAGRALVEAASSSCDGTGPRLYGEVYTPRCARDTGR